MSANTLQIRPENLPAIGDGLSLYMQQINAIPLLSKEQEFALATRLVEENDLEAAKQLVLANLRFVVKIARGYLGYGLALPDLIQEGTYGLMKAVKRFDPKQNVRLVAFAVHWIKAQIHEYVIANWRIVKVATTKAQRKLFFNLRKKKSRLGFATEAEIKDIAQDLGVKPEEVKLMEQRLSAKDEGFDVHPDDTKEDNFNFSPVKFLPAKQELEPMAALAIEQKRAMIHKLELGLKELDERSAKIIQARYFQDAKVTLKDLANEFGVSVERVRQLEASAMQKLRSLV